MRQSTILINGVLYDASTGLPVEGQSDNNVNHAFSAKKPHHSHEVHRLVQKSQTLNRQTVRKSAPVHASNRPVVKKSPTVSKFASHPAMATSTPRLVNDIGPSVHPIVKRTHEKMETASKRNEPVIKPAAVIKNEAMKEALDKAPSHMASKPIKSQGRAPKALSLVSMTLVVLLLGGYFTYINLPSLSVRVAAAQAGIDASYPSYRPDGYRMAGVNYSKGAVSIKFAANAGPQNFTITQQHTSWDSTAVNENYVKPKWGDDVIPYAERGLTIYASGSNAAWVNGGILYTISGDAPLSSSQVRSIATNL